MPRQGSLTKGQSSVECQPPPHPLAGGGLRRRRGSSCQAGLKRGGAGRGSGAWRPGGRMSSLASSRQAPRAPRAPGPQAFTLTPKAPKAARPPPASAGGAGLHTGCPTLRRPRAIKYGNSRPCVMRCVGSREDRTLLRGGMD